MAITLILSLSPLKTTLVVIYTSIIVAGSLLIRRRIIFPSLALVISFSTGIIILFCYCALLTRYEKKRKINKKITLLMIIFPIILYHERTHRETTYINNTPTETLSAFLLTAIGIVLMSILSINKNMFNPKKSLRTTY